MVFCFGFLVLIVAFLAACFSLLVFLFYSLLLLVRLGFGGYSGWLVAGGIVCCLTDVGDGVRVWLGGGGCLRIACFWFGVTFRFGVFCFCGFGGDCLVLTCLVVWVCGCDSVVKWWWSFDFGVCCFGLIVLGWYRLSFWYGGAFVFGGVVLVCLLVWLAFWRGVWWRGCFWLLSLRVDWCAMRLLGLVGVLILVGVCGGVLLHCLGVVVSLIVDFVVDMACVCWLGVCGGVSVFGCWFIWGLVLSAVAVFRCGLVDSRFLRLLWYTAVGVLGLVFVGFGWWFVLRRGLDVLCRGFLATFVACGVGII